LKSGLKELLGCSLKPSTDSSDETFKEKQKLRKRKRH
jgi:hypothetical protein